LPCFKKKKPKYQKIKNLFLILHYQNIFLKKMKRNYLLIIGFLLAFGSVSAQYKNCEPDNTITLQRASISEFNLRDKIRVEQKFYDDKDIQFVKSELGKCNAAMDDELRKLESKMSTLSLKYQEVLGAKDMAGIQKQIADLEKSRAASLKTLEENLAKTKHTGIFVVLLREINLLDNKNVFIKAAQDAIAPLAVEHLNGERITRLTSVENLKNVKDVVTSFKGGEMTPVSDISANADYKNKSFLYAVKVQVTPIKNKATLRTTTDVSTNDKAIVLNALLDSDYENTLKGYNVPESILAELREKVSSYAYTIDNENLDADTRQANILQQGEEEIRKIDADIQEFKNRLATRGEKLKAVISELPGVTFNANDLEGSANQALNMLKKQIADLAKQWNTIKEREIQYKETKVTIEGDPSDAMAKESMRLYEQLQKNYTTIRKSMEFMTVENFEVKDFQAAKEVEVFREVNQIWAYLCPQSDGSFKIMLLSRFKITNQKPVVITPKIEPKPEPKNNVITPNQNNQTNNNTQPKPKAVIIPKYDVAPNAGGNNAGNQYTSETAGSFRNYHEYKLPGLEMIAVSGGNFQMGDENGYYDEKPVHSVRVSNFYMSKYEITVAQWGAYCSAAGKSIPPMPSWGWIDNHPIVGITYEDAQGFCEWLSATTGKKYRLPTEAEWEFAARGGNQSKGYAYAGSNSLELVGWYAENSNYETHPVGQKLANELGLFDMSGNAAEWCSDWYDGTYYKVASSVNPKGPNSGGSHAIRGGSFKNDLASAKNTKRKSGAFLFGGLTFGLRVVREAQ